MFLGQTGRRIVTIVITIDRYDQLPIFKTWRGSSVRSIRRAAREKYQDQYPDATLLFGNELCSYSYGAH